MARDGELAEPRIPAPAGVRPVLSFSRMTSSAYAIVRRAVDEDPAFRSRVAAEADEREVGRPGWLWLHRPDGWEGDPSLEAGDDDRDRGAGTARLRRERDGAEAAAVRFKQVAAEADAARLRAEARLADAHEAGRQEAAGEAAALHADLTRARDERNQAVRAQKGLEAELADTRRDLKTARAALVSAEAELAAARAAAPDAGAVGKPIEDPAPPPAAEGRPGRPDPARPEPDPGVGGADRVAAVHRVDPPEQLDRHAARLAVDAAAAAAAELARALAQAAEVLGPTSAAPPTSGSAPMVEADAWARPGPDRRSAVARDRRRSRRVLVGLPPGVFDDSLEAHRHLIASAQVLLIVDGYNLARAAWSGLEPEEERRRTVALLEEVGARSGGSVVVVFDGDDRAVAPAASRAVRVQFSATGITADEAIAELLASVPGSRPVVVVSSDREVADDARQQGAAVLGAGEFLAAARR